MLLQKEQKKVFKIIKFCLDGCLNCFLLFCSLVFIFVCILVIAYVLDNGSAIKNKIFYQIQWYSSSSIQYQTLEHMTSTLKNELTLSKFYKDLVYHQIKKQVKESENSLMVKILTGRSSIGKSTSIRQMANQMMSKGTPVYFISLAESFEKDQYKSSEQILNDKILKSQMWNLIRNWKNSKNSQTKVVRFNQIFKEKFKNKNLVLIIDEINTVSKLCQRKCPPYIQPFFRSLNYLKKRGANIILLSSDPDFTYLVQISQIRTFQQFEENQIQPNPKKDFKEMFQEYKIKEKQRKQILKYFGQRGSIINFLQSFSSFSQKNRAKRIEKLLNQYRDQMLELISHKDQKTKKNIYEILMKVCKQQDLQNLYYETQYYFLGQQDILFNKRFNSRIQMRAFEKYAQNNLNLTTKCKQPENIG